MIFRWVGVVGLLPSGGGFVEARRFVVEMPKNQHKKIEESINIVAGPIAASDSGLLRPTTEVSMRERIGSLREVRVEE